MPCSCVAAELFADTPTLPRGMPQRLIAAFLLLLVLLLSWGCSTLDEKQRAWIFQPSDRAWGSSADEAEGMDDVWIDFKSRVTGEPSRLHGLWLEADRPRTDDPVLLYL